MSEWRYTLDETGTTLRQLIKEEGKEAEIIEQIEVCLKSLLNQLSSRDKDYHKNSIEELSELLEGEAETIRTDPDAVVNEWGFDNLKELIDARLTELYDICDSCRCWVQL